MKKINISLIISLFACITQTQELSQLTEPYNNLTTLLPFDGHGWYANASHIEKLFQYNTIHTAIEVGSWLGCSTRHIATLLPEDGKVYAVDTWLGSVEHYTTAAYQSFLPTLYEQFLSNIVHAGLTNKVIPKRMDSLIAAQVLTHLINKVEFIYIDAAHDTESVLKDLDAWYPYIANNNGILCGDDWWWETVRIAVRQFAQKHNLTIYCGENFWFLKKSKEFSEQSLFQNDESIWKILR